MRSGLARRAPNTGEAGMECDLASIRRPARPHPRRVGLFALTDRAQPPHNPSPRLSAVIRDFGQNGPVGGERAAGAVMRWRQPETVGPGGPACKLLRILA